MTGCQRCRGETDRRTLGDDPLCAACAEWREDLLVTLVADVSGEGKADTRAVFEELRRLRSRYASMEEDDG